MSHAAFPKSDSYQAASSSLQALVALPEASKRSGKLFADKTTAPGDVLFGRSNDKVERLMRPQRKPSRNSAPANVRRLEALESFKSIVAPFDGVVTQRNTEIGALINAGSAAGQELFEVSDLHRVRIYVQVPQASPADLHPGLKATFEMPQYPGRKFDATLVATSNAMNVTSRSMLVELQSDNSDGRLLGGTYCQVEFQIPGEPNTVRMPVNHGLQVAVLGNDNEVVLKSVELGRDFGDSVDVTAHLKAQISRELDRLELLIEQIKAVETERNELLAAQRVAAPAPAAMLLDIKGIGPEFAAVLWSEGLFRHFDNRRQVA